MLDAPTGEVPRSDVAASRFLKALDPTGGSNHFMTLDDNRERNDMRLFTNRFAHFDESVAALRRLNCAGAGVYVVINKTDGYGRKLENIVSCRAAHGDFDDWLPSGGFPLEPTLINETSPGRHHALWLVAVNEVLTREAAAKINDRIAKNYDADPQAKDVARLARIPGFLHLKREPFRVRLVGGSRLRYRIDELQEAFPALPVKIRAPSMQSTLSYENEEPYRRQGLHDLWRAAGSLAALEDGRRNLLFSLACGLAKYVTNHVLAENEVRTAFREAAAANGSVSKYGLRFVDDAVSRALQMGRNDQLPPLARRFRNGGCA